MNSKNEKITSLQALMLYMTILYTPAVRVIAGYTAKVANQAAWISPLISLFGTIIVIYIIDSIYKKYKDVNFMYAVRDIMGTVIGRIITWIYIITILLLLSLYLRFYAERLAMSIFPTIDIDVLIWILLIIIAIVLRKGLEIISRMNQIIWIIITIVFFSAIILMLPSIDIKNLTPISFKDILPILHGSISPLGILVYILFVFFIGDKITEKEKFFRNGVILAVYLVLTYMLMIAASVGSLGHSLIARSPLSFFIAIREIAFFGFIERIESFLIATWILTDFMIVCVFLYVLLDLIKVEIKLNETKSLINIFLVFVYILSLHIAESLFELTDFSNKFILFLNIGVGLILPIIIWSVGKVRMKV